MRIVLFFLAICVVAARKGLPSTGAVVKEMIHEQIEKRMPHPEKRGHIDHSHSSHPKLDEANDAIKKLVDDELAERVKDAEKYISQNLLSSIQTHIKDQQVKLLEASQKGISVLSHHEDHHEAEPQPVVDEESAPVCKDTIKDCSSLKEMGVCETSKDAMKKKCSYTCDLCPESTEERKAEAPEVVKPHKKAHKKKKTKKEHKKKKESRKTQAERVAEMYSEAESYKALSEKPVELVQLPPASEAEQASDVENDTAEKLRAAAKNEQEAQEEKLYEIEEEVREKEKEKKKKKKHHHKKKKSKKHKKTKERAIQKDLANACNPNCKFHCLPSCASIPGCCDTPCPSACKLKCHPYCKEECCNTPRAVTARPAPAPRPEPRHPAPPPPPPAPATLSAAFMAPTEAPQKHLRCPSTCPKTCELRGCTPECCSAGGSSDAATVVETPPQQVAAAFQQQQSAPTAASPAADPAMEWAAAYGLNAGTCPSGCSASCAPACNFECCKSSLDPAIIQQMQQGD